MFDSCQAPVLFLGNRTNSEMLSPELATLFLILFLSRNRRVIGWPLRNGDMCWLSGRQVLAACDNGHDGDSDT